MRIAVAYRPAEHESVAHAVVRPGKHVEAVVLVGVLQRGLIDVAPAVADVDEAAPAAPHHVVGGRPATGGTRETLGCELAVAVGCGAWPFSADNHAARATAQVQESRRNEIHLRCFDAHLLLGVHLHRRYGLHAGAQLIVRDVQAVRGSSRTGKLCLRSAP